MLLKMISLDWRSMKNIKYGGYLYRYYIYCSAYICRSLFPDECILCF